jgi:transcriptional regulator with XRE-family HTH domain
MHGHRSILEAAISGGKVDFFILRCNAAVMKIGEVISRARRATGLKQKELAAAAGVHVQTLKRLEGGSGAGSPTVRALEKALAKAGASWQETDDGYELRVILKSKE